MGRKRIHKDKKAAVDWWHKNNRKRARLYEAQRDYGITKEQYEALYNEQEGCCAICSKEFEEVKYKVPSIDHNHSTGRVRGMLCGNCNRGLGSFKDSLEYLANAMAYLNERMG